MPEVASSGAGGPEVQMLFTSPTKPEPAWQRPTRPPMSPTPGTLQIPASSWFCVSSAVTWFPATRAACPDDAAVPDVAAGAACAAGIVFAAGPVFATGPAFAVGAACAAGAAL